MTTAADMVQRYTEAEEEVLLGRTVQWGDRQLGMPDLEEIRRGRREWERRLVAERRGSRLSMRTATFEPAGDPDDG